MTLRFIDSAGDHYALADITTKWTAITDTSSWLTIASGTGRRGTNCLHVSKTNNTATYVSKTLDSQATWTVGFAFNLSASPTAAQQLLQFYDTSTLHVDLRLNADNTLSLTRNGTTLATSSNALSTSTWYYIEVKVTIADSGTYELRVNGSSTGWIPSASGDTRNAGNASANTIRLGVVAPGGTGFSLSQIALFDDIYINDANGSTNTSFLGDVRVDAYLPNGNGNYSQFTGSDSNSTDNYLLVDDTTPNGDTDYVQSSTVDQIDSYAMVNMSHTPSSIYGLQVYLNAKKDDAGTRSLAPFIRSNSTDSAATGIALGTSYTGLMAIWETDPGNSNAAWSKANVNALEVGGKVTA